MFGALLGLFASAAMVQAKVIHPSSSSVDTFKKEINSGVFIVDFFATWCGPCKKFAPTFEKTSSDFPNITFMKVDVDRYNPIAKWCRVRSMPTIVMFKDGKKVASKTGAMSYSEFKNWINKNL